MKRLIIALLLFSNNFYSQVVENGIFTEEKRLKIIEELSKLSGKRINNTNTIILNFYIEPEKLPNGSCIDYYTNDYSFKKFVKRNKDITQFFITERMYKYSNADVLEDKDGGIKEVLFENAEPCGNFIIIRPNGEYIKNYGEYRQDEIPKLIKNKK